LSEDTISSALKRMKDQEVKDRLFQYTKQALDEGVSTSIQSKHEYQYTKQALDVG
jgi:hypothetical protein